VYICTVATKQPQKLEIMTISKTLLKKEIETTEFLIQSYNEESKKYPQIANHNDKQVLKMQGKIEAYNSLIQNF